MPCRVTRHEPQCPIIWCAKCTLLIGVIACVLFYPFGDPQALCDNTATAAEPAQKICTVCHVYRVLMTISCKIIDTLEAVTNTIGQQLYNMKMMFYSSLERVDGNDLCKTCCVPSPQTHSRAKKKRHSPAVSPKPSKLKCKWSKLFKKCSSHKGEKSSKKSSDDLALTDKELKKASNELLKTSKEELKAEKELEKAHSKELKKASEEKQKPQKESEKPPKKSSNLKCTCRAKGACCPTN